MSKTIEQRVSDLERSELAGRPGCFEYIWFVVLAFIGFWYVVWIACEGIPTVTWYRATQMTAEQRKEADATPIWVWIPRQKNMDAK